MLSALPRRARIAVGIEGDGANAAPVAGRSGPALRMTLAGKLVYPSACLQLDLILTGMANGRGSLSDLLCVRHKLMAKEPRYATQTQGRSDD
ncbi:hypothetical protein C6T53_02720 [Burkholderia multivorans]|nr:hypothetical protein C6T53_02720 [Burkholderia multivorans]